MDIRKTNVINSLHTEFISVYLADIEDWIEILRQYRANATGDVQQSTVRWNEA